MGFIFENGYFSANRKNCRQVHWIHARKENVPSKGIVFAPPLIGAGFSMEISNLRKLMRHGYELFSFNYTGHGRSSEKFRLKAALQDTGHALDYLLYRCADRPVFGIASCYSAIPLIHAAHHRKEPLEKLILINALFRLDLKAVMRSFISYCRENACCSPLSASAIKIVFLQYMAFLFPGIDMNRNFFGSLLRQRTHLAGTMWDALFTDPLNGVCLQNTPVLGLYGKQDRVLKIFDKHIGEKYENQVLDKCPQTRFHPLWCDHFLSSSDHRKEALDKILSFLGHKTI